MDKDPLVEFNSLIKSTLVIYGQTLTKTTNLPTLHLLLMKCSLLRSDPEENLSSFNTFLVRVRLF